LFSIVSGTPTTACSYRVYTSNFFGSTPGRSYDYDFFWAMTTNKNSDGPFDQPAYSQLRYPMKPFIHAIISENNHRRAKVHI
jgi:hypothetical protein